MVPNDELSERVFRKFEFATEYGGGLRMDQIKDHLSLALLDWLKKGGLENRWTPEENNLSEGALKLPSPLKLPRETFLWSALIALAIESCQSILTP
jgi:hypothetical protein